MRPAPPRVLAISPPAPGPWVQQLDLLVQAGVDGLVLRLVDAPETLATVLDRLPGGLGVLVRPVAAGDEQRALDRGLGLHLPAARDPGPWRERVPGLLSAACHDAAELARADAAGCDLALLSPVFRPGSKPGDRRPTLGVQDLRPLAEAVALPVLALGGITADRAAACVAAGAWGAGAWGVAAIGAFFSEGAVNAASARALVGSVRRSAG